MLERVLAHELPFAWVTADSVYGADYALRRFLLEHHIPFVLAVAPNHQVRLGWQEGCASIRLDEWLTRQGRVRWSRISAGWGSKGPRWFDWTWWKRDIDVPDGWQAWVVVRRSMHQIVQVAGQRWKVEEAIERSKAECGLDQYEVRRWTGWYRHYSECSSVTVQIMYVI
jgi:SRSO17 transposase